MGMKVKSKGKGIVADQTRNLIGYASDVCRLIVIPFFHTSLLKSMIEQNRQ